MITDYDKKLLTEAGRDYIFEMVLESKYLKENISFKEHVLLCDQVSNLTYEEVISLTITEDIRAFEGKFSKFLKYSIAAIAGMVYGGIPGPPVAMFVLYLYRKLSDTCTRACFRKMPLSRQRKICKLECQLNAAKKMANDIRSEMNKCIHTRRATKCEKALQREYIKWAKRVQQLTVRYNTAKMTAAEKERKRAAKAAKGRAITAGLDLSTKDTANFIAENEQLRQRLPFEKHLELYRMFATNESEKKVNEDVGPVKVDPKKEKRIRQAMYLGLWLVPVPFFNDVVNQIVKKYSAGCAGKCGAQMKMPKDVCYSQCSYLGAKHAVAELTKQMGKCNKAETPEKVFKCKKAVMKLREDWKQREVERKIKFESLLRKKIEDIRIKKQKQKEKEFTRSEKAAKKNKKVHY